MITALISAIALGQCLLTAHLLARRVRYANVYLPLAALFLVNAIVQICFILREIAFDLTGISLQPELRLFRFVVELGLPPLIWIYVRELTSEYSGGWRKSDCWHFVFPLVPSIVFVFILIVLGAPIDNDVTLVVPTRPVYIDELTAVLNIVALAQFCVYTVFVMKRLAKYRRKLMNLFASTSNMELRWFLWGLMLILAGIALEIASDIFAVKYGYDEPFLVWKGLLRMAAVWFFAAWGLRQRPDLLIEIARTHGADTKGAKYQNSGLTQEQLLEISVKIKTTLEKEMFYRDPTLSLRTLSEQINILPNYVSQALNTQIEETFFDYVNRLRVEDAMAHLEKTSETVLYISTLVGFNSRSSFYTAFKKVSGKTPTAYRKAHLEG